MKNHSPQNSQVTLEPKNLNDVNSIETFYTQFTALLTDSTKLQLFLDLSKITFLSPQAVLTLICVARLWKAQKHEKVEVLLNHQVQQYVERINLFSEAGEFLITPTTLEEKLGYNKENNTLLEVMAISPKPEQNALDVYKISVKVRKILGSWLANHLSATCTLLNEIIENVTHSGDLGFAMVQRYENQTISGSRVQLGVVDTGIGIEAALRPKFPDLAKGSDYLAHALKLGITSRPDSGGLGLYNVDKIVKEGQGTLLIRSKTSMIQVYKGQFYQWDDLPLIPGTQIFINIWGEHPHWQKLLQSS